MLSKLLIKNFKIHRDIRISLSNLTLLTGLNSSGKSSVIQILLLLRQSWLRNKALDWLQLNGDLCDIGFAHDAFNQNAGSEEGIDVTLSFGDEELSYSFHQVTHAVNEDVLKADSSGSSISPSSSNPLFGPNFQYISAARWSPRDSYPLDSTTVVAQRQISKEKGMCEYLAHFMYYYGVQEKTIVPDALRHPDHTECGDLLDQITFWEREISSNISIKPEPIGKAFSLFYSYLRSDGLLTDSYSAQNVGFGISYALPIIVALLTSKKDSMIIIENPEAHLHAQGQAALMRLAIRAASYGIQVIIETHSDFILNGVLLGVKQNGENPSEGIPKELVSIYHFARSNEDQSSISARVQVLDGGHIDSQPDGFFDQMNKDLQLLMGF